MKYALLGAAVLAVFLSGGARAQEVAVPVETHLPLLAKILEYDRSFKERDRSVVVLGVIYQKSWRKSALVFDELVSLASRPSFTMGRLPVRIAPIDVSGTTELRHTLEQLRPDVLYLAPVRGIPLDEITRVSAQQQCRTVTGVPEFVEEGIAIGIGVRNDRPLIVVNLPAAKACGADLSSQLLRLARVVE